MVLDSYFSLTHTLISVNKKIVELQNSITQQTDFKFIKQAISQVTCK